MGKIKVMSSAGGGGTIEIINGTEYSCKSLTSSTVPANSFVNFKDIGEWTGGWSLATNYTGSFLVSLNNILITYTCGSSATQSYQYDITLYVYTVSPSGLEFKKSTVVYTGSGSLAYPSACRMTDTNFLGFFGTTNSSGTLTSKSYACTLNADYSITATSLGGRPGQSAVRINDNWALVVQYQIQFSSNYYLVHSYYISDWSNPASVTTQQLPSMPLTLLTKIYFNNSNNNLFVAYAYDSSYSGYYMKCLFYTLDQSTYTITYVGVSSRYTSNNILPETRYTTSDNRVVGTYTSGGTTPYGVTITFDPINTTFTYNTTNIKSWQFSFILSLTSDGVIYGIYKNGYQKYLSTVNIGNDGTWVFVKLGDLIDSWSGSGYDYFTNKMDDFMIDGVPRLAFTQGYNPRLYYAGATSWSTKVFLPDGDNVMGITLQDCASDTPGKCIRFNGSIT